VLQRHENLSFPFLCSSSQWNCHAIGELVNCLTVVR